MRSVISFCISAAILGAAVLGVLAQKRTPVLVELFTSEGCDTCPPADKYLQRLLQEQPIAGVEIIAMAEHVDYWNRLGWIDPFSSALFSIRQQSYATFFKHESVYTPQIIVNGTHELRAKDGVKALEEAARDSMGSIKLEIKSAAEDTVSVTLRITKLPALPSRDHAVVTLAVTEDDLRSNVLRGENGGKELKHMAVVRLLRSIGPASGEETDLSTKITLEKNWKRDDLSIVAFVQDARSGRVLAAARIELKH
jgi:hypothetical protein